MVRKLIRFGLAGIVSVGISTAAPVVLADNPVTGAADKAAEDTSNAAKSAGDSASDATKSAADKASETAKGAGEATEDRAGREEAAAGGGELDREREPVHARADLGGGAHRVVVHRHLRPGLEGAPQEERDRRRGRERVHVGTGGGEAERRDEELVLAAHPEAHAARDEGGGARAVRQQLGHRGRGRHHVGHELAGVGARAQHEEAQQTLATVLVVDGEPALDEERAPLGQ